MAKTDSRGIAWCRQNIGTAPYGTTVSVESAVTIAGRAYTTKTAFTPTQAGSATPTAAATAVPTKRAQAR
jgi:hypothetical protein